MSFWDSLDPTYQTILCDVWGVIHDGGALYPGAHARLQQWRDDGRNVIFVTNAPRPASSVARVLSHLGLEAGLWTGIATSGEAGIAALLDLGRPVGFIGSRSDRADLEERGVAITRADFTDLAATGVDDTRSAAEDYRAELVEAAARGVTFHCLNPDRIVIHRGTVEVCAGAMADIYEALGGRVEWYGKPHAHIYEHALHLAGDPPLAEVLAIGDSVATDMAGAAGMGIDAVYVAGGIHRGERFPDDFGALFGHPDWRPVATVDGLE